MTGMTGAAPSTSQAAGVAAEVPPAVGAQSGHGGGAGTHAPPAVGSGMQTGIAGTGATAGGGSGSQATPPATGSAGMSTSMAGAAAEAGAGAAGSGTSSPMMPEMYPPITAEMIGAPMRLSNTLSLAEGPLYHHCAKKMLFTDVEAQVVHTIEADGTIGTFRTMTNYANGLAFDMLGRLLLAEMGGGRGGRLSRIEKDGMLTVLADKNPRGGELNTTDDVIVRSDGVIYFSDPVIPHGPTATVSITSKPLYRLPAMPGAMPIQEEALSLPNGVDLSPDEKVLYVAEYLGGEVSRFDVGPDGALSGKKRFLGGLTNPDSMCLDVAGNVYVGVEQGLVIARPDGTRIKTIAMQTNKGVTNCGFGGEDGKTLYITAWASLWKIENMPLPGLEWTVNKRVPCDP